MGRDRRRRAARTGAEEQRGDGRGGARRVDGRTRPGRPATSAGAASSCPGYLADLVVLDRDPFAIPAEELPGGAGRRDDGRRPLDAQRPPPLVDEGRRHATGCRSRSTSRRDDRVVLPVGSTEQHAYLSLAHRLDPGRAGRGRGGRAARRARAAGDAVRDRARVRGVSRARCRSGRRHSSRSSRRCSDTLYAARASGASWSSTATAETAGT